VLAAHFGARYWQTEWGRVFDGASAVLRDGQVPVRYTVDIKFGQRLGLANRPFTLKIEQQVFDFQGCAGLH
jgi:hypothetical protein